MWPLVAQNLPCQNQFWSIYPSSILHSTMAGEAGKNRTVLLATEKAFAAGAVAKIESVVNDAKYTLKFYGSTAKDMFLLY